MKIDRLTRFNDWWTANSVNEIFLKEYKRPLFDKILDYIEERQILLVTGLRRVGKTTLFYQLIQKLLDDDVEPSRIIYFSFDQESGNIEEILETYKQKVLKKGFRELDKLYVFFDEIQKSENWQNKIKIYYDLYPNIKFFISGSASVNLERKSKESLAGRIYDFKLKPLSFREFLNFKGLKIQWDNLELYEEKIKPLFFDYLRKGGFPEIIDEEKDEKIRKYIRNSVIEKIIYKDLPVEFGIRDIELLKNLMRMIAENPGMILNYNKLSRDLKRSKKTIIDYISYLEYAMVVKIVYNYRKGFRVSSRKLKKLYLTNTGISFAFVDNFYEKNFLEKIVENIVISTVNGTNYYRNSYEIDLIMKDKTLLPIEVKYGEAETKGMKKFLEEFDIKKGIIVTKEIGKEEKYNSGKIIFIPVQNFLLKWEELSS